MDLLPVDVKVGLLLADVKADVKAGLLLVNAMAVVKAALLPVVAMADARVRRAVIVLADRSSPNSQTISITQAGGSSLLPARCVERSTVRQSA